jgi:hypothetical protein
VITEPQLVEMLREHAVGISIPSDLAVQATARGRRRRRTHRTALVACALAAMGAAISGLVILHGGGSQPDRLQVAGAGGSAPSPWWQTWPTGRHYGAANKSFLEAIRPRYDGEQSPEQIRVYAAGTTPDGTNFALFTDQRQPHVAQWMQGWFGHPNFGAPSPVSATVEWMWFASPNPAEGSTTASADAIHEWLIVVGRPGTTRIEYSPAGANAVELEVRDGIGVIELARGLPPKTASVRLFDSKGEYSSGRLYAK